MWNAPDKETLDRLPRIYETEGTPLWDKIIRLHFFLGGSDWYIVEYDGGEMFWGFTILNADYEMAEWGYISYKELRELKAGFVEVDCDLHWTPCKAREVEKIRKCEQF
jgi:hypothetical protein